MKKCLSLMLALVMVFGLAACGAKPAETQPATDAPSVQPVTEAPTQAARLTVLHILEFRKEHRRSVLHMQETKRMLP